MSETATFPLPLETTALLAVRSEDAIVVAAPEIVADFAFNCVCIDDVTPST